MPHRATFERTVMAALTLFMVVAVGLAAANWKLVDDAEQAGQWVEHTHKVIASINEIQFDSLQIEYAVQNFRVTGNLTRMDDRKRITALREAALNELRRLTSDNPRQQERWANLRKVINERIAYASKIQQLRVSKGKEAADAYVSTVPLEETRNLTYQILAEMDAEENSLLEARQNAYRHRHRSLLLASVLIAVFLCLVASSVIVLIRAQLRKTREKQAELEHLMQTDALTGINNRRMMMTLLAQEIARSQRYSTTFTVAYMDIDHFKRVNDQYGHGVGDEVLVQIAICLRSNLRQTDHLARFGGEEFLILLTETALESAQIIVEKLRVSVSKLRIAKLNRPVTISAGLAQWHGSESDSALLSRADKALYRAKEHGRNCTCIDTALPNASI